MFQRGYRWVLGHLRGTLFRSFGRSTRPAWVLAKLKHSTVIGSIQPVAFRDRRSFVNLLVLVLKRVCVLSEVRFADVVELIRQGMAPAAALA